MKAQPTRSDVRAPLVLTTHQLWLLRSLAEGGRLEGRLTSRPGAKTQKWEYRVVGRHGHEMAQETAVARLSAAGHLAGRASFGGTMELRITETGRAALDKASAILQPGETNHQRGAR